MSDEMEDRPHPDQAGATPKGDPNSDSKSTPAPCPGCGVMPTQSGYDHGFACWVLVDVRRGRIDDLEYFRTHSRHEARVRHIFDGERVQLAALTGQALDRYAIIIVRRQDLP